MTNQPDDVTWGPAGATRHMLGIEEFTVEKLNEILIDVQAEGSYIGVGDALGVDDDHDGEVFISMMWKTIGGHEGQLLMGKMEATIAGASLLHESLKGMPDCQCGQPDCSVAGLRTAVKLIRGMVGMDSDAS